eukprot:439377-Pleurochrysis_carterae.AAC.3
MLVANVDFNKLKQQLPAYLAASSSSNSIMHDVIDEFTSQILAFWRQTNPTELSEWRTAAQIVFFITSNSASCERFFSLVKVLLAIASSRFWRTPCRARFSCATTSSHIHLGRQTLLVSSGQTDPQCTIAFGAFDASPLWIPAHFCAQTFDTPIYCLRLSRDEHCMLLRESLSPTPARPAQAGRAQEQLNSPTRHVSYHPFGSGGAEMLTSAIVMLICFMSTSAAYISRALMGFVPKRDSRTTGVVVLCLQKHEGLLLCLRHTCACAMQ